MARKIIRKKFQINLAVEFENWDSEVIVTDEILKAKVEDLIKSYYPISRMSLGSNSGNLVVNFKSIK